MYQVIEEVADKLYSWKKLVELGLSSTRVRVEVFNKKILIAVVATCSPQ